MSTEMEAYEEPLTERAAKALDDNIRKASEKVNVSANALVDLLDKAARGQIHVALSYPSWTAWFSDAVQIRPSDKLERKALASLMSGQGMSQRAIAGALGVSQKTVDRDLEGESFDSDTVTALDGKQQPRNKPPKDDEPEFIEAEVIEVEEEEPARPVSEDFQDEMWNLRNTMSMFGEILEDERMLLARTRKSLAGKHVNNLQDAIKGLQDVIDFLMS